MFKDPVTDPGKRSKAGRLDLVRHLDGAYETIPLQQGQETYRESALVTVYENGPTQYRTNLADIRERMKLG